MLSIVTRLRNLSRIDRLKQIFIQRENFFVIHSQVLIFLFYNS